MISTVDILMLTEKDKPFKWEVIREILPADLMEYLHKTYEMCVELELDHNTTNAMLVGCLVTLELVECPRDSKLDIDSINSLVDMGATIREKRLIRKMINLFTWLQWGELKIRHYIAGLLMGLEIDR